MYIPERSIKNAGEIETREFKSNGDRIVWIVIFLKAVNAHVCVTTTTSFAAGINQLCGCCILLTSFLSGLKHSV